MWALSDNMLYSWHCCKVLLRCDVALNAGQGICLASANMLMHGIDNDETAAVLSSGQAHAMPCAFANVVCDTLTPLMHQLTITANG